MSDKTKTARFNVKGFTSLVLTLAFLVVTFSGIILYVTPKGRVAHWTDWTLLGLGKEGWSAVHMNAALLFLIAAVFHLVWNWGMLWGYIKKKAAARINLKVELVLAIVIGLVVVVGTILDVPPFSSVVEVNDAVKRYWARRAAAAPVPHAEEFSLAELAAAVNLSVDDMIGALREEGFEAARADATVREVARQKGVAPSELFDSLRKHFPEIDRAGPGRGRGAGRGAGQGMGRGAGQGFGRGAGQGMGRGGGQGMGRSQREP